MRDRSVKGLRYNLAPDQPIANAVVQHRGQSTALYIVPTGADDKFELTLKDMILTRPEIGAWVWRVSEGEMPPLRL